MTGTVEYIIRGSDGKPYRCEFLFNTTEELAKLIDLDTLLTIDEIVAIILDEIEDDEAAELAAMDNSELITLHHTAGRDIRNSFGLWIENNPNIINHPDDTSMEILTQCWNAVRKSGAVTSQEMKF